MKIRNTVVLVLALFALAACSSDKNRIDYKVASAKVHALEVPPDLTSPGINEQYVIPGADGALAANFSDYSKGSLAQPASAVGAVLPVLKNVRMERNDKQRWIVVSDKAENVWPAVKAFWLEMGFQIQVDNPQSGVMETDWQENRGNVPQSGVRYVLSKIFDSLKPAGQRDQYVIRIERSKDGLGTEVYLAQQVMEEAPSADKKDIKWVPRANNPEIEIAMLQMLMTRLGGEAITPAPGATASASAVAATAAAVSVQLKEVAGSKVIQIGEPFDKSWRKVGLALDKAGIAVEDKDRANGIYLLRATPAAKGKKAGSYQVAVRESGAACEVSVRNAEGGSDKESSRIVEALYQSFEK